MTEKAKNKTSKEKLVEVTSGLEPIVGECPVVEIEGQSYKIRRLGIQDTFRVAKLIGIGIAKMAGTANLGNMDEMSDEMVGMALIAAIPYAENEILDFLADLVGVSHEDIRNPERFPLGSELAIIEALSKHQDLRAFFTRLQNLLKSNPSLQQMLKKSKRAKKKATEDTQ